MFRKKISAFLIGAALTVGLIIYFIPGEEQPKQNAESTPVQFEQSQEAAPSHPLGSSETYRITMSGFPTVSVAPSFINEQLIAFDFNVSDAVTGTTSYIRTLSRTDTHMAAIYQTTSNMIINSLVGVEDQIFWVEYPAKARGADLTWQIKTLDLTTNQSSILRSGSVEDQIEPPVLRVYGDQVTWIEKKMTNHIVYSMAIRYEPLSDTFVTIATTELDERELNETNERRSGIFLLLQRPIKGGMLIEQSRFRIHGTETDKSFELVFYPYDKSHPTVMKESKNIIDYTANDEWFVWTENGKISVASRKSGELVYTIHGKDEEMAIDTPFILDHQLYYRDSMDQIMELDLTTGKVSAFSAARSITTKIFNSGNYLGYAYRDAMKADGKIELTVIESALSPPLTSGQK